MEDRRRVGERKKVRKDEKGGRVKESGSVDGGEGIEEIGRMRRL